MRDPPPDIPEELIIDILVRLSVKSIDLFKCVSKQWRSLLSSPQFVNSHLNFHRHNKGVFAEDEQKHTFGILTFDNQGNISEDKDRDSRNISFPMFNECKLEGSCDGLVLLRHHHLRSQNHTRFLVNPITLEAAEVPAPFHHSRPLRYCLGYDSFGDDYEIASLACFYTGQEDTIHIYSVRTKTWKTIEAHDHQFYDAAGTFFNGRVHWLAYGFAIVALNLRNEEFEEFPLPFHGQTVEQITVLGGCLCVVLKSRQSYDVWVMKEYGKHDSWTQLFTVDHLYKHPCPFQLVCALNDDEMVLLQIDGQLVAYNWRSRVADFHERGLGKATAFTESLISPNCNW